MKIIHTVDVSGERNQQGVLLGASWPIGVHLNRDETIHIDMYCFATLQEAEEQAQEWVGRKRGHTAVVYQRTSGIVRAQYVQLVSGFQVFVRYDEHHALLEQHNLHLFEGQEKNVRGTGDERTVIPLFPTLQPHIVPLLDGERDEDEVFAYLHIPVPNKISIDIVPHRPVDEPTDDDCLLTVQIDFTDGTLSVLCWNRELDGQDPHKFVAATLPVSVVTQRLSHYQMLRERATRGQRP